MQDDLQGRVLGHVRGVDARQDDATFVEAVLRFGVSASGVPRFCAFMLQPSVAEKQIRPLLAEVAEKFGKKEEDDATTEEEYYPYVFMTMTPVTSE